MEQARQWKKALIGLVIIVVGIIIEIFAKNRLLHLDSIVSLLFGTCIGLSFEAWGGKMIWMAFLNVLNNGMTNYLEIEGE